MRKMLIDMFVKQQGSYERLIKIARFNYPDAKPVKTETLMMEGSPVLVLHIEI